MLKPLRILPVLVLPLLLADCSGMRPLYGTSSDGQNVAASLSSMSVEEQHTRAGQIVRNELLDGVSSGNQRYALKLAVTERTIDVATLSSSIGSRKRYNISAHFELIDSSASKSMMSGDSFSNVEFDTVNVPVSDLQAAEDARMRAAKELGQDIRLRLAAHLSSAKG